jgi:hypothetical protein
MSAGSSSTMPLAFNGDMIALFGGVGGFLFLVVCVASFFSVRFWLKHKHLVRDLESHGIKIPQHNAEEVSRPRAVLKRTSKIGYAKPRWNLLGSSESFGVAAGEDDMSISENLNQQHRGPEAAKRALARRPLDLRNLKGVAHLSAVLESPQGSHFLSSSPSPPPGLDQSTGTNAPWERNAQYQGVIPPIEANESSAKHRATDLDALSVSQIELRPRPLFSVPAEGPKSEPRVEKKRSKTVTGTVRPSDDVFGISQDAQPGAVRPSMHSRSFSFGSHPPTSMPDGPIPPLPVKSSSRPRSWLNTNVIQRPSSRQSISSMESVGSSLLVGSPRVGRSVSARLRTGANRDWKHTVIFGPRPLRKTMSMHNRAQSWTCQKSLRSMKSVHSCEGQYSVGSSLDQPSRGESQRNSAFEILDNNCQFHEETKTVDDTGSNHYHVPTPRTPPKRESNMHNRMGSHMISSPPLSPRSTGVSSTRSSDGNPFQWDPSPMQTNKPSVLKGSPTARKGHRRQQCVRISVPGTVMSGRAKSPTVSMADILEEGPDQPVVVSNEYNSRPRSLPRPPSVSTFNPDIKLLRGSLTPSSSTLSLVGYSSDNERQTSVIENRASTRLSNISNFKIPSFPSPVKTQPHERNAGPLSYKEPAEEDEPMHDDTGHEEFKLLARPLSGSPPRKHAGRMRRRDEQDDNLKSLFGEDSDAADESANPALQPGEMVLNFDKLIKPTPLRPHLDSRSCSLNLNPCQSSTALPLTYPSNSSPIFHQTTMTHTPSASHHVSAYPTTENPHQSGDPNTSPASSTNPSPVRQSVALLRRMNSDAQRDCATTGLLATRRYLQLDRANSPSPRSRRSRAVGVRSSLSNVIDYVDEEYAEKPGGAAAATEAASNSAAIDGQFRSVHGGNAAGGTMVAPMMLSREDSIMEFQHAVDDMLDGTATGGASEFDIADASAWGLTDVESLLDLHSGDAFSGFQQPTTFSASTDALLVPSLGQPPPLLPPTDNHLVHKMDESEVVSKPSKRMKGNAHEAVSVWEDGETFWNHGFAGTLEQQNGGKSDEDEGEENLNPAAAGLKSTPFKLQVMPPSDENTPTSMYDGYGFLKGC